MIKNINNINFAYKGELHLDDETNNKVKLNWEKLKKKSTLLKEGNILIVDNIEVNEIYNIELKSCKFSYLMYCKKNTNDDIHCLFSGAYIRTSDDNVVCVLNKYYDKKEYEIINLVGGMADTSDIINNEYNSLNNLKREFKEELGFELNNNYDVDLKYIKVPSLEENSFRYAIGLIYEISTKLTKEQIKEQFENSCHDDEISSLIFFDKNNFRSINNFENKKAYIPELLENIFS